MPFPEKKRVVYKNHPLTKVICQLRYPPILKIDSEVPSQFQEAIRSEYPLYKETTEFQHEIAAGLTPQAPQEVSARVTSSGPTKNHQFASDDDVWRINLTHNFLSISTSKYPRWEGFIGRLRSAYDMLSDIYDPPFFTRLGLRYQDIFVRSKLGLGDTPWVDLLQPYFLGVLSSEVWDEVKSFESVCEVALNDDESVVRIRTGLLVDVKTGERCYMVDSDFFVARKTKLEEAFDKLEFLHGHATRLIQWIVKDKLHNAMEPETI